MTNALDAQRACRENRSLDTRVKAHTLIFGGTFDPVHLGHLKVAREVQQCFHFSSFLFLPSQVPVHKKPAHATPKQRIHMLNLALAEYPIENASVCLDEIHRPTPSYTIETLRAFRKKLGTDHCLTFLLGLDAFISLPTWHECDHLLECANFLVINRNPIPVSFPPLLKTWVITHHTPNAESLLSQPFGGIHFFDAGLYPISSQEIRACISHGQSYQNLVTNNVYRYLNHHKLY